MSLNKKSDEVAHYIKNQYPNLNFGNVSVSDSCVTNICNIIFNKENDNGLKKSITNAINRNTSSLRKRITSMNNTDLCNVSEMNSKIIKCIENCNYTSSDFLNFNVTILNAICKHIKVAANRVNRTKLYRKCKKHFDMSLFNPSDDTDIMNSNSVYFNENSSIENFTSYSDHTEPELVHKDHVSLEYTSVSPQSDCSWMIGSPLIPCSTPILPESIRVESDFVTPSKLECRKMLDLCQVPLKMPILRKLRSSLVLC
ncbi:unnamed protein product [Macrosiphum euphorbiae]|uniref:Uncharacterized protein n=1 Tax=Macrosiphum euphorbiae TaxID=13131 RepID=A0AAV0VVY6_9HEMI|nr:unnamed protein product [Macrosiphum euphorbiae]